jgi:hypothetical protein
MRAACRIIRPIGPAPSTTTDAPASIPADRAACRPIANGSIIAPSAQLSASGSGWTKRAGAATTSAIAPSEGGMPRKRTRAQRL